jgi:hypothetical protein
LSNRVELEIPWNRITKIKKIKIQNMKLGRGHFQ